MLEQEVRRPKSGTNMAIVLSLAEQKYSPEVISQETGMPIRQIKKNECLLRNRKFLPELSPQERQRRMSEAGKLRRSTIDLIEPYVRMRMSVIEIEEALSQDGQKSLSREKIMTCILNARRKHNEIFSPFTPEEQQDLRIDSKKSEEERRARVKEWVETARFLQDNNIPFPKDRFGWKEAIGEFKTRKEEMSKKARGIEVDKLILTEALRARKEFVATGNLGVFTRLDRLFEENPGSEERLRPDIVRAIQAMPSKMNGQDLPRPKSRGWWDDINFPRVTPMDAARDLRFKNVRYID